MKEESKTTNVSLLNTEEQKSLLIAAENLWDELNANKLGGYSGINRPFYIAWKFREVIEKYGHRNIGQKLTGIELEKLRNAG